jgi:hypothetical protein
MQTALYKSNHTTGSLTFAKNTKESMKFGVWSLKFEVPDFRSWGFKL